MATINRFSPSRELKERLANAFPGVDIDVAELDTLFKRPNLTDAQRAVKKDIEQLLVETANE